METLGFTHTLIVWGILAMQIASLALLLGITGVVPAFKKIVAHVSRHAILISFFVVLISVLGSLYYSEIAGFEACTLCWAQRFFVYPQVVLFALALYCKRRDVLLYTNALSIIALGVAVYNIYIQTVGANSLFCEPGSIAASCLEKYVEGLGYITIPVMSATALVFLLLTAWAHHRTHKN